MAVNSYREDEHMENSDKKKIIIRLFSYLKNYKKKDLTYEFDTRVVERESVAERDENGNKNMR